MDDKIERWADDIPVQENAKSLDNINSIDMECNFIDDDDFGGGNFNTSVRPVKKERPIVELPEGTVEGTDGRCLATKTGVKISFNDDDDDIDVKNLDDVEITESKPLVVQSTQDTMNAKNNTLTPAGLAASDLSGINEIDMECNCCEDDCDDYAPSKKNKNFDFGDDDEIEFVNKELVDEGILEEKNQIDQGTVEKDYWAKLQKKHAKSNTKGAYNVHMHFSGNPEQDMKDFNHDMGSEVATADGAVGDVSVVASAEGGMGESKNSTKNYQKLFEELLLITGFDVHKDNDGNIVLSDRCNFNQPVTCKDNNEVFTTLRPYIEDAYIYPLQYQTKQNFTDCEDWCNWYNDEMKTKYPKLANDIDICDLIANHSNEVIF